MIRPTTKEVARFFDKVRITKHCWLWLAGVDKNGYGKVRFRDISTIRAHRFSYELFVGPIELGELILHRRECGNPSCVNPNHLYMGTNIDNMRDRDTWGNGARGERSGVSKLSDSDVLAIRETYKTGDYSLRNIADMFGISKSQSWRLVTGQSWKHLP